jgi:mevalonate kinase
VNFTVTVTDGGEPSGVDTFTIVLTGPIAYTNSQLVQGGNIQAHGLACP